MVTNVEPVLKSVSLDPALLDTANTWFGRSWWGLMIAGGITALAACATVVFLIIQFWSSNVKERFSDERVSANEAETASAKEGTARANQRIEELRAANLALEAQIAPRRLTKHEVAALTAALSSFADSRVAVSSYQSDPDGAILAAQLIEGLTAAKIVVGNGISSVGPGPNLYFGITVNGSDAKLVNAIVSALPPALVKNSGAFAVRSGGSMYLSSPMTTGVQYAASIMVGVKQRP
ncbi:hypothetical protein [Bradyrhizobium sp. USDA 327]